MKNPDTKTERISIRLEKSILDALAKAAKVKHLETNAYIELKLREIARDSQFMSQTDKERSKLMDDVIEHAKNKAYEIFDKGNFDEHFTLIVFRALMKDKGFVEKYSQAIEGDPYDNSLPGKTPLNMNLGRYIANAAGAMPIKNSKGNYKRVQVKNEPIQSYTLLKLKHS